MKTRIILIFILGMGILSCNKNSEEQPKKMDELVISETFKWNSTIESRFVINVNMPSQIGKLALIKIFDKDPAQGGKLLSAGSAGFDFPFEAKLVLAADVSKILVQCIDFNGVMQQNELDVSGLTTHTFNELSSKKMMKTVPFEPDCTGDVVLSGGGNITIENGLVYVVTGSFNGNLNFVSGTLKICGTASLNDLNVNNNCSVVVTSTGSLTANNLTLSGNASFYAWSSTTIRLNQLNQNNINTGFYNYSTNCILAGSVAGNGAFFNDGQMTVNGNLNRNSGGDMTNYGNLTVGGTLNLSQGFTNSGSLQVGQAINFNTASNYYNFCKITAGGNISLDNGVLTMNEGYIQTPANFIVNGGGTLKLMNQAMLSVGNMMLNKSMTGAGAMSSIIVAGTSTINGSQTVSGPVEWADNDGVLTNGSAASFINGASFVTIANQTNYIPQGECNPTGTGNSGVSDADGDGIGDDTDAYPADPERAFNAWYPSEDGWAGLAFEDLWPQKGDYDFNDLVLNYRVLYVSNASNRIVEINGKYQVMAVGAAYKNGFGIQFDKLKPNQIASVSGQVRVENYIKTAANGTEANQLKAVIIPWDNVEGVIHRVGGSMFNTVQNGFVGTSDVVDLSIRFAHPMQPDSVDLAPFNPFLIRQMKRNHEIHLVDQLPTSLMDMTLFGTVDDASQPGAGKYYRTSTNLTWGIHLPEVFDYPVEHAEVTETHLKFSSWAESNGANPNDWYKNKNGYRNNARIYSK